jgi:hypothetical protein
MVIAPFTGREWAEVSEVKLLWQMGQRKGVTPMRLRTLLVSMSSLIAVVLLLGVSFDGEARHPVSAQSSLVASFTYGEGPGCLLVVVPKVVRTWVVPPSVLSVPVFVTVSSGGTTVELSEVTVQLKSYTASFPTSARLEPQARTRDEILNALAGEPAQAIGVLRKGIWLSLEIDVSGLGLRDGEVVPITVTASGLTGATRLQASTEALYGVTSLPSRAGWYAGDGHIHTAWSPDVILVSIDGRASSAVSHGLKWIVITDHADGIGGSWPSYVSQCNTAQTNRGIPVLPGFECTALEADSGADALGYACKETASSIPTNNALTPQQLIDAVNAHNTPYSYSVIAHPYGLPDWDTWTATGYRCMELLSNEATAKSSTVSKWFSLLSSGLANTILTGKFVVGTGNSDCHNNCGPGDTGLTWLYCPSYGSTNRTAIWNAIRAGAASASALGDLGCFSLNNYMQGSVVNVFPGSTLEFKLVQQPLSTSTCTQLTIYKQNQTVLKGFTNPSTTETIYQTTALSTDTFYLVKFTFFDGVTLMYYEVWASPVFVNVP